MRWFVQTANAKSVLSAGTASGRRWCMDTRSGIIARPDGLRLQPLCLRYLSLCRQCFLSPYVSSAHIIWHIRSWLILSPSRRRWPEICLGDQSSSRNSHKAFVNNLPRGVSVCADAFPPPCLFPVFPAAAFWIFRCPIKRHNHFLRSYVVEPPMLDKLRWNSGFFDVLVIFTQFSVWKFLCLNTPKRVVII